MTETNRIRLNRTQEIVKGFDGDDPSITSHYWVVFERGVKLARRFAGRRDVEVYARGRNSDQRDCLARHAARLEAK